MKADRVVSRLGGLLMLYGLCSPAGCAGDVGSDGTGGSAGAGGVDCSLVGCAAPPLCSTGCTEVCGCCPCAEGETNGLLLCAGGCWASPAAVCQFGADQTCNDDPVISSLHGTCQSDGSCVCNDGFAMNPDTGRCL